MIHLKYNVQDLGGCCESHWCSHKAGVGFVACWSYYYNVYVACGQLYGPDESGVTKLALEDPPVILPLMEVFADLAPAKLKQKAMSLRSFNASWVGLRLAKLSGPRSQAQAICSQELNFQGTRTRCCCRAGAGARTRSACARTCRSTTRRISNTYRGVARGFARQLGDGRRRRCQWFWQQWLGRF